MKPRHHIEVPAPTPYVPDRASGIFDTGLHADGVFFGLLLLLVSFYKCAKSKLQALPAPLPKRLPITVRVPKESRDWLNGRN